MVNINLLCQIICFYINKYLFLYKLTINPFIFGIFYLFLEVEWMIIVDNNSSILSGMILYHLVLQWAYNLLQKKNFFKEYQISKLEMKTCKGEPVDIWTLTGFEAEFTNDCSILAKGCAKLHTDLDSIVVSNIIYIIINV